MSDELTPEEQARLAELDAILADPAVWAEPPNDLQERVVAAVEAESGPVRRRRRWLRYAVPVAAAGVAMTLGLAVGLGDRGEDPVEFAGPMTGTELAPGVAGDVTLTKTTSGWRIHLEVAGMPRRDDGEFYEAWLKDADGLLVPIGTFNEGDDVVLWSGVGPAKFPNLTVTREVADGNQASSGQVVLVGQPRKR